MCITVAWSYRDMLCEIEHSCYSAPAEMAFFGMVPYAAGILLCVILAIVFRKKARQHFERRAQSVISYKLCIYP